MYENDHCLLLMACICLLGAHSIFMHAGSVSYSDGSFYISAGCLLNVTGSSFVGNVAAKGSAITGYNSTLIVSQCTFEDNTATGA
jgi:hypothetical protein